MKNSAKQQFTTLLSHADSVLLVGAKNWALDDAAALLALQKILIAQKKNVVVVAPDEIPTEGKFLAGKSEISKSLGNGKDLVISVSTENAKIQDISSERHEDSVELVLSVRRNFLAARRPFFRHARDKRFRFSGERIFWPREFCGRSRLVGVRTFGRNYF